MTKVNVLDKGFIKLVDVMGSDKSIVNSARISFNKQVSEIGPKDEKLIKYLWEHKHTSPFRHATLQFHIKAPLFVLRQWMKHQIGCSWNEASGRYIVFDAEFYMPDNWRKQHESNKQGSKGSIEDQAGANLLYIDSMRFAIQRYLELLDKGVCKEQARMVLPLSLYTECYWTASLQSVMHFLALREDSHAQLEIQEYAKAVRELSTPHFPISLSL